jgi:hypothetical protein
MLHVKQFHLKQSKGENQQLTSYRECPPDFALGWWHRE